MRILLVSYITKKINHAHHHVNVAVCEGVLIEQCLTVSGSRPVGVNFDADELWLDISLQSMIGSS